MKKPILAAILIAVAVSGCVSSSVVRLKDIETHAVVGSRYDHQATVYLFRSDNLAGGLGMLTVSLDGIQLDPAWNKHSYVFPVTGGSHRIFVDCSPGCAYQSVRFRADFVAGETYYFMVDSQMSFGYNATTLAHLQQLDQGAALHMLLSWGPGNVAK